MWPGKHSIEDAETRWSIVNIIEARRRIPAQASQGHFAGGRGWSRGVKAKANQGHTTPVTPAQRQIQQQSVGHDQQPDPTILE